MMKLYCSLLLIICFFFLEQNLLFSQNNKEQKTQTYAQEAFELILKKQDFSTAFDLFQKANQLSSKKSAYKYEMAHAQYALQNYHETVKILKKIIGKKEATPRHFQLLGNAYDLLKKQRKAQKIYEKGILRFPSAGELYLELGGLTYKRGNTDKAVEYWERGIEKDPTFASNYYWVAKMFCHSGEKVWGLLYGELFLNLERKTKRSVEISELLYETYAKALKIEGKKMGSTQFSERAKTFIMLMDSSQNQTAFQLTHELNMDLSFNQLLKSNFIVRLQPLASFVQVRSNFIRNWQKKQLQKQFANILYDWHKVLIDKNYFESYSYFLLMKGNEKQFKDWLFEGEHEKQFNRFLEWYAKNPLRLNKTNKFYRLQYVNNG